MKKLFLSLIAVVAFALAVPVDAQVPTYYPNTLLTAYQVTAAKASNNVAVIDVRKQKEVAITWIRSGSTNNTMAISASIDGINYDTNRWVFTGDAFTNAPDTTNLFLTNINVGAFGYLRVDRITNAGTINQTNWLFYSTKISAP